MHHPLLNIAIEAALSAGKTMARAVQRLDIIKVKEKRPNDFVTDIDKKVEEDIIRIIKKAYPNHAILGEEGGEIDGNDYQWVIDPIDGTRNFIHGFPHFAVSIAILHKGRIEHGVIYDPMRQELFAASRGKGALLNEHRIRVATRNHLKQCLLGTGFAYRHMHEIEPSQPGRILQAILPLCGDIRRAGAATLDLAYVACGRLDGFWEFGLKLWDFAAGILLIKEAGGFVCDPYGGEDYMKNGRIIAANPTITKEMLKVVRTALSS